MVHNIETVTSMIKELDIQASKPLSRICLCTFVSFEYQHFLHCFTFPS